VKAEGAEPSEGTRAVEGVLARLEAATPETPVALGRYDVVGRLGRGGMGTVYEGVDRERRTRVALKALLVADAAAGVLIKREFRTVADVAHPSLAPVYELACEEGLWFFAMERIDGVDVRYWARGRVNDEKAMAKAGEPRAPRTELPTRVEGSAPHEEESGEPQSRPDAERPPASLPVRGVAAVRAAMAELVSGLSALHDAGLWHGDIKPGNVLVRSDGRVVVVDFGLARPVSEPKRARGPTSGTPTYMAPEQLVGGDVGPPSDWYAVGTLLYELLTGRLPFGASGGASHVELYIKKTLQTPTSPRELLADIPADLSDVCMRLLRPDTALRPTRQELVAVFAGEASAPATPERRGRAGFVGRGRELNVLERAYERARSGRCMVAHVHGPSGIGKSAMVRSFLGGVRDVDGAEVLRGRCYERESVPYKAFDGIVDELTARLVEMGAQSSSDEVDSILPAWVGELAQAFPALAAVPAIAARVARLPAVDVKELRRRAWTALRQLLEVVGRERTVVMWIDDLQWADADSAGLLESLVKEARRVPLLIIASHRSAEAAKNAALKAYFDVARRLGTTDDLVDIGVGALSRAEAAQLARSSLEALTGDVAGEARVRNLVEEAAGVPFFIEELARYVAAKGATGDVHASLEDAIAARLRALPPQQRALVEVVAVADSPVAQSIVFEAAGLDADALPNLLALRSASMLSWTGPGAHDLVSAYHDRIRESVLAGLDADARKGRHLALGRAIAARHTLDEKGAWVFDAVRHLGAAATALTDPHERFATARLHLKAGRAAREAAAFPLAFACFEGGIALLAAEAWTAEYDLALALHNGAAETAYLSAEWTALDTRVADVKAHGRTAMDQLVAWEVQIDALAGRHEYIAAVDTGMQVLELLGVSLPREPGEAEVGAAFQRALESLTRVGPEGLAAMADVDDPLVAAAMRVQVRVSPAAYFAKPMLLPIIAANLVSTSVARGLSMATPYALALFGIVLNTVGMFPVSHAWGQLAVRLIDRWEDRSLEAATRHVVFNLVCAWMVPLSTILEPLREVFDIGRRTGDLEYASYAAHGYVHNALYAGRPLAPLLVEAHELGDQMRALGQVNAVHVHAPFEQLLKCLTGGVPDPGCLNDDAFDEETLAAKATAEGSRSGIHVLNVARGLARFHFGRAKEASACFEIARAHLDAAPSVWHVPILHQFAVLSACAAWQELDADERAALRPKMEASLAALRTLAGHTPINFAHRVSLVEGELRRIDGDPNAAFARFVEAAELAREGAWVNDVALARELASRCQRGTTAKRASLEAARDGYAAWGASAKAAQLDARIAGLE
jgi:predicted ATPase